MSAVWFNGDLTRGNISFDPADRGLLLGDGVFETIAVINQTPLWIEEHLARMQAAALELGIPFDNSQVSNSVTALLRESRLHSEVLRITLTRGKTARGLKADGASPGLLLSLDAFDPAIRFKPVKLELSEIRRNEFAPSSRLKTLSYADGIMASRAVSPEADEALMRNTAGHVASSPVANIFALNGRELVTPKMGQGILKGITRQLLLDAAEELNLMPVQRIVRVEDLLQADAVFLCNSLRFISQVTCVNGRTLNQRPLAFLVDHMRELVKKQCRADLLSLNA